jgi:hypothetical protein
MGRQRLQATRRAPQTATKGLVRNLHNISINKVSMELGPALEAFPLAGRVKWSECSIFTALYSSIQAFFIAWHLIPSEHFI